MESFEDIEKKYEIKLDNKKVTIFRLDGHGFSKFTKNFKKPFDDNFTNAMKETAKKTFSYFNFSIGFVGSDEITLCIFPKKTKNNEICEIEFSGRIQKMISLLCGFVSVTFYKEFSKYYSLDDFTPHFDCRVYQVDTVEDCLKNISERITYTIKNSKMMFAQSYFSSKKLFGVNSNDAIKMVKEEKGYDFEEIVNSDNIYGNVLTIEKIKTVKIISILEEERTVEFMRTETKLSNIEPKEIFSLVF